VILIYGIIYCANNIINEKRYIGQTIRDLDKRKKEHISQANNGSKFAFHLAINKYGEDKFEWSIIDVVDSQEELDNKELYWIDFYNTYKNGGYNMSVGGQFGKKTDSNADDLSIMNGGREFLVFDIEGNFIKSMYSQSAFAIEIGSCVQSVNNALHGKKNKVSVKRKIMIFKDEFTEEKLHALIQRTNFKEFVVFDLKRNFVGKYNIQTICAEELKISTRSITRCLNNSLVNSSKGYMFYYLSDIPENLKKNIIKEEM